jgi:hypothetical protein
MGDDPKSEAEPASNPAAPASEQQRESPPPPAGAATSPAAALVVPGLDAPPIAAPAAAAKGGASPLHPQAAWDDPLPALTAIESYLLVTGWRVAEELNQDGERTYAKGQDKLRVKAVSHIDPKVLPEASEKLVEALAALEQRPKEALEKELERYQRVRPLRLDPYSQYAEGDIDPEFKSKIGEVVFQGGSFWVYLEEESDDVVWSTADDYGAFPEDTSDILNRVALLQSQPIGQLGPTARHAFRRLVAEGVARLLDDRHSKYAAAILDKAEQYLQARNGEVARQTYLQAATGAMVPALLVALFSWCARGAIDREISGQFAELTVMTCLGSIGAFLSVFFRLSQVGLDANAGGALLQLEGGLRVVAGMCGALVISWALKAGVFTFGTATDAQGRLFTLLLAAVVAGASERLFPTLIATLEKSSEGGDKGATPKGAKADKPA